MARIGILAFGSLIGKPGDEIAALEIAGVSQLGQRGVDPRKHAWSRIALSSAIRSFSIGSDRSATPLLSTNHDKTVHRTAGPAKSASSLLPKRR